MGAHVSVSDPLKELQANLASLRVIHFSCQSLSDANEGYSPRITSIAVLHVERSVMHSFSIHLVAEEKRVARDEIESHYDGLEGEMLSRFFQFVAENPESKWLHWNMSNINYGFETLSHRYKVLTGKDAPSIPDTRRYNLSSLITTRYGSNCVDHPRMTKLMELNGGVHRDFLNGQEEANAFEAKEFVKLHKSTMSKAYWFQNMFWRLVRNKVVTQRSNWMDRANRTAESRTAKVLGLIAVLCSLAQIAWVGVESLQAYASGRDAVEVDDG
jgi:hypothetical protein